MYFTFILIITAFRNCCLHEELNSLWHESMIFSDLAGVILGVWTIYAN